MSCVVRGDQKADPLPVVRGDRKQLLLKGIVATLDKFQHPIIFGIENKHLVGCDPMFQK